MIHLDRRLVPAPAAFRSARCARALRQAADYFAQPHEDRGQRRFSWHAVDRIVDQATAALTRLTGGKCAYCEQPVQAITAFDIDGFRPRGGALGLDGSLDADHYWWLAGEWTNLLPVCPSCNFAKSNRFPVAGPRAAIGAKGRALAAERPLLLDPCLDRPEKHLVYDESGRVSHLSDRGRVTIEVLSLNRVELVRARAELARGLADALRELAEFARAGRLRDADKSRFMARVDHVFRFLGAGIPYQAIARQMLHQWLKGYPIRRRLFHRLWASRIGRELPPWLKRLEHTAAPTAERISRAQHAQGAREKVKQRQSVEGQTRDAREAYFSGARRIERIEIRNFKSIRCLDLTVPPPTNRESWLMFIGENATGKSSLLQAVALALLGEDHIAKLALDARRFVTHTRRSRRDQDRGTVRVFLTNLSEPVELSFNRRDRRFHTNPRAPQVLLLAYGATRLLPRVATAKGKLPRYVRARNLFNPYARLQRAEFWLTDHSVVSDERFTMLARALKKLLLLDDKDRIYRHNRRVLIQRDAAVSYLGDLSDGYQSIVALAVDIMVGVAKWPSIEVAEGVVLVDEIETHLHPRWKMEIVERLRTVFPRMLFLCTTHDPLCLRGLQPGEIVVLRPVENNVVAEVVTTPIDHLRADQLLTSPLFGLAHTRAPVVEENIARYTDLLGKARRTAAEEGEMQRLRETLGGQLQAGETESQRRVEVAVSAALDDVLSDDAWRKPHEQTRLSPTASARIRKRLLALAAPSP
ncbi:MAG TPA: AAA family ATPase [Opitutaceae bacterium]|nr:AAA family ATPase [Opitutaceae bacterium]